LNVEESATVSNLSIFPVPANDVLNIRFNNQNAQSVVINLVNNVGQIVRNINLGTVSGVSNVEMDVNNLSSGVYAVQISNGNSSVVRQIVVQ
jgi:flagellar hook assembly protein FlgD